MDSNATDNSRTIKIAWTIPEEPFGVREIKFGGSQNRRIAFGQSLSMRFVKNVIAKNRKIFNDNIFNKRFLSDF